MNFKKIIMLMLAVALVFCFAGCGKEEKVSSPIKIAALNGPTGLALLYMMDDENYEINTYQAPTDAVAKLISKEVDVALIPSNLAAVVYNKTGGQIVAISPVAMDMLYMVENGNSVKKVSDLKGKTIVASGQGGTPEYVLEKVLEGSGLKLDDVNVKWLSNHSDVNAELLSKEGTVAMIPEPFLSVALSKGEGKIRVAVDLGEEWENITDEDLPMGVIVCQRAFLEERKGDLEILASAIENSVEKIDDEEKAAAELAVEKGFFDDPIIAERAIENCEITFEDREESKEILKTFFNILFELDPKSIGGKLPGEDLYY